VKIFVYTYQASEGKKLDAKVKAETIVEAKSYLRRKRIKIISITEEKRSFLQILNEDRSVSQDELVAFSQLFAGCIRSGLTVKESLSLLSKQVDNKLLQNTISEILIEIEGGTPLSMAFSKQHAIFPKFYGMLIKAGEASGDLASVLEYLGNYLEKINDLKKDLKGLFTYPAIVSFIGLCLLVIILLFVAPVFKDVFQTSKTPLPLPTAILFFLSDLIKTNLNILLLSFTGILSTLFFAYRSPYWKRKFHYFYLTMPIFGNLARDVTLLQFLRAFDILVNNDVPILQSLQVLEEGMSNIYLKDIIQEMRRDVARGLPIAGPLVVHKDVISPLISQTITMGEKSGNLGPTIERIGNYVDKDLTYSMKKLSSRLDPLLTLGIGLMVLFIALAIYLPIFDMMAVVN
jgi:type IV pilus assembly protein PilC